MGSGGVLHINRVRERNYVKADIYLADREYVDEMLDQVINTQETPRKLLLNFVPVK